MERFPMLSSLEILSVFLEAANSPASLEPHFYLSLLRLFLRGHYRRVCSKRTPDQIWPDVCRRLLLYLVWNNKKVIVWTPCRLALGRWPDVWHRAWLWRLKYFLLICVDSMLAYYATCD